MPRLILSGISDWVELVITMSERGGVITVYISAELKRGLEWYAKAFELSLSGVVRRAISHYLYESYADEYVEYLGEIRNLDYE